MHFMQHDFYLRYALNLEKPEIRYVVDVEPKMGAARSNRLQGLKQLDKKAAESGLQPVEYLTRY